MSFTERIQSELTAALKAKAEVRLSVLRMLKTALRNREVEKQGALNDADALAVVKLLVKQRREAVEEYRKGGRGDRAAQEENEIAILESYLPAAVSEEEIRRVIEEAVAETAASSVKEMGKVMKVVMSRLAGKNVDGKRVNELARARLTGSG
ncbi:MAG: GatB/YqeY domain-containing protein [Terriglobia bacterium]